MIERFFHDRGRKWEHVCRVDCGYLSFTSRERAKETAIQDFRSWCRVHKLPLLWRAIPGSGVDLYVLRSTRSLNVSIER